MTPAVSIGPDPRPFIALALHSGHLGAAAPDPTRDEPLPMDSPRLTCPNLTLVPHFGGSAGRAPAVTAQAIPRAVAQALAR